LNGTYQLLVYVYDFNILEGSVHTIKENLLALIVASKETGLEVNTDKTKFVVMSRDQNAGRSKIMKTDKRSFEMVEDFKYLGTTLTIRDYIQEQIKSRLKSGNAWSRSVQNRFSSSFLSKNIKLRCTKP
jgi:hypothetical protein